MALELVENVSEAMETEQRKRSDTIEEVRAAVFKEHPDLLRQPAIGFGPRVTTRWDLKDALAFTQLPKAVQTYINNKGPKILHDSKGKQLVSIFPGSKSHSAGTHAQLKSGPAVIAVQGNFASVTPAFVRIPSTNGTESYQRVGLKRCRSSNPDARQQFDHERLMASHLLRLLDHEDDDIPIARPIAVGQDEILYEWCANEDGKAENLAIAELSAGDYVRCIADAASGLSWLHKKRIKYHDLCEGNIIVVPKKRAKLIDFGSARFYEEVVNGQDVFNERYYDWRLIMQQDLHRDALDIADKYALGVLIRTFLLRFDLATIMSLPQGKRELTLRPEFQNLQPIVKISNQLRASVFHPYPHVDGDISNKDAEYRSLATIHSTFEVLARILDIRAKNARQVWGVINEIVETKADDHRRQ